MLYQEVVFLQPGFLGFDRFNNFSYFDQRVVAALRSHLEDSRGYPVPVVPLPTCPSSTLAVRQAELMRVLRQFDASEHRASKYHIVGHSTGGVDAALLLNEAPLNPAIQGTEDANVARFGKESDWNKPKFHKGKEALDPTDIRSKIGTVVPLSAPQWGTTLTEHPITRWFRKPRLRPSDIKLLADWLPPAVNSVLVDDFTEQGLLNSLQDGGSSLVWLVKTISERQLVDCLLPAQMTAVQNKANFNLASSKIKTVVTAVAKSSQESQMDELFDKLYSACTGTQPSVIPKEFKTATSLLESVMAGGQQAKLIANPSATARNSDMGLNDGIVNSARQLVNLENQNDELLAVVLGDHLDVLGHYPMPMSHFYTSGLKIKVEERGILKSGSGFGDSEFLALWRTIAAAI